MAAAAASPAASVPPTVDRGDGQVRVAGEKLDVLLASTEQLLIAGSRVASRPAELAALHDFAARWATEWRRAGRRLRLALERSGASAATRQAVHVVEEHLGRLVHDTSRLAASATEDARTLAQATDEVADRVRGLRMRPFAEACEALPRAVRDIAAAVGKEVQLEIRGGDVHADRAVLDGLREAILHLVRNAVDHGIEPPVVREQAGKSRTGTVAVAAAVRGDRIIVTVADDGAGLDVPAIRAQLERRGVPVPTAERDLAPALLAAGVSTRAETTAISGRGVGLDIVRAAVGRIRGKADVTWVAGRGTTFTLECPPTLATVRALLVAVGPQILAVPTIHIARLARITPEAIRHAEGRQAIATRTLEQSILDAAGYDVLTAVDGGDGWRVLQEHGADLVVADIEMPRMDGFALCEAIRASKRFKELPVVLVTALETPEHRARGLEVGADAYLGKSSFDQQNLLDTITQLLGES